MRLMINDQLYDYLFFQLGECEVTALNIALLMGREEEQGEKQGEPCPSWLAGSMKI